jgi:hypothetical protein
MIERQRKILTGMRGSCPFCDSENYIRANFSSDADHCGDYAFCECICQCGKHFQETFFLNYQDWIIDG